MRIGIWIRNNADHTYVTSTELGHKATPKIFSGNYLYGRIIRMSRC